MEFKLNEAIEVLERTPTILYSYLYNISEEWLYNNEGGDSWSPFDIIGHLIHGEKTDWIPRTKIILSNSDDKSFIPFDRFAQFENSKGKSINELLKEFLSIRVHNLKVLKSLEITPEKLKLTGIHPEFGSITLEQLLATWVVHDLGHIAQVSRVLAHQYKDEIGPWKAYIPIVNK
ncbi:MAG: DinB family protein [Flavobacteriaceae bacterium]|nr:DinB family protein [Flavobacteriaceae bacterium]